MTWNLGRFGCGSKESGGVLAFNGLVSGLVGRNSVIGIWRSAEKHLAHLPASVLDDYAEWAEEEN